MNGGGTQCVQGDTMAYQGLAVFPVHLGSQDFVCVLWDPAPLGSLPRQTAIVLEVGTKQLTSPSWVALL